MKQNRKAFCLYGITGQEKSGVSLLEQVRGAIAGGITMLQIREKGMETKALISLARPILELCRKAGVPCLLNDDVEAVKLLGADGVHVGQQDMCLPQARRILGDHAWIGTSAHSVEEAVRAQAQGADYIGCGAVFPTGTKVDASALSLETLRAICQAVTIPVVAIGGITAKNALQLEGCGMDGIAVVSAIFGQKNPQAAAVHMRQLAERLTMEREAERL